MRVAARGSGAGSLVNHLVGISGVDPVEHGLLMERFCTPLRAELPDIDIDVESDRRTEIYEWVLERFGGERVSCVSMMDTYRVRHAVRDAGAALGLPPSEIDAIATAFPHIRAKDARNALRELPELRRSGLGHERFDLLFDLVERLDALPRHIALHPCGMLLSNATLLDRTPVEASWQGFPMSQFDKDDVEVLGLLKLDVLGIRMQSAMAYALDEVERVDGVDAATAGEHPTDAGYLDPGTGRIDLDAVPLDDEATFRLVRSTRTLGCFQIESPGQRELVGKFAPQAFSDLVIDISLFRPGPVKSDMISPFLRARQGWDEVRYLHETLIPALEETHGVVVFHEQVIKIVHVVAGVRLDEADEVRRADGDAGGPGRGRAVAARARRRARLPARRRAAHLGGAEVVRLVRLLQGPCRCVRAAHLPVGLAEGAPPGGLPRRRPHPRPRHVPQAADPRRRAHPRHRGPRPRRQRLRRHLPGREGGRRTARAPATGTGPTAAASSRCRAPRCVSTQASPTPAATASGCRWPTSRASARPRWNGSWPASRTARSPTCGTGPGPAGRSPNGWCSPARSTRCTGSAARCRCGRGTT